MTPEFLFQFFFTQSKVFPVTIHLGKLFFWRHLSNWSVILVCKLFKSFIQYSCTLSGPWKVRHFCYLLSNFLNFNIYVILYCQFFQFILHISQPIWFFSVRHRLVQYITPKASALPCIWYHTFSLYSLKFVEQSLLVCFK